MKVIIVLNWKTPVSTLIDMAQPYRAVMGVITLRMSQRDPTNERRHSAIHLWREHHMPMVVHPLISDQVNLRLLQAFRNQALESFERDIVPRALFRLSA